MGKMDILPLKLDIKPADLASATAMVMTSRAKNTPNFMVVIFPDLRNDVDFVKMIPIVAQSKTNLIF